MRKIAAFGIISVLVLFLGGFFVVGCGPRPPSQAERILKGEHKLRKMAERTDTNSRISASFFILVGSYSSTTETKTAVKFAWEMNDGTYALSSLPLEKIRVKLDEKATVPTIKFRWRPYCRCYNEPQVQELMDNNVCYAVVTVKESDWPVQVNLPMNQ